MNKFKKWFRDWHIWLGVAFSLPLIVIGITTILLAHGKELKLDDYYVSSKCFPGYWGEKSVNNELKVYFMDSHGKEYFGYKYGIRSKKNDILETILFFEKDEIRALAEFNGKLIVATKKALFIQNDISFEKILAKDIWNLYVDTDKLYVVAKEGLFMSNNLQEFQEIVQESEAIKEGVSLKKLNLDLHTGKALFGKSFEWIWQDILAICILFFVGSGFFLWYKRKTKK